MIKQVSILILLIIISLLDLPFNKYKFYLHKENTDSNNTNNTNSFSFDKNININRENKYNTIYYLIELLGGIIVNDSRSANIAILRHSSVLNNKKFNINFKTTCKLFSYEFILNILSLKEKIYDTPLIDLFAMNKDYAIENK